MEEQRLLRDVPDPRAPRLQPLWREWHLVNEHGALCRCDEAHQQVGNRALASAGWSYYRGGRVGGHMKGDILQRRPPRRLPIAECHPTAVERGFERDVVVLRCLWLRRREALCLGFDHALEGR